MLVNNVVSLDLTTVFSKHRGGVTLVYIRAQADAWGGGLAPQAGLEGAAGPWASAWPPAPGAAGLSEGRRDRPRAKRVREGQAGPGPQ